MEKKSFTPLETAEQPKKRRRFLAGFTAAEILIVLIIVGVLAALTLVSYQKTVETTHDKICKQNLKIQQAAIDVYTLENNTLPVTLSQLTPEHIHLAYLKVAGLQKENSLLNSLKNIFGIRPALAQSLRKYYGNEMKVLLCPADPDYKAKLAEINAGTFDDSDSSYNFRTDDKVFDPGAKRLKKNSVFAILYDKSDWHKDDLFGGSKHANGITPGGIKGKMDGDKVKKADVKDNGDGSDNDELDEEQFGECQKEED